MRLDHLPQVARVAIVMPPAVRMGSVGVLVDCLEMTRAQVRRQYGAVDVLSAADRFGVVEVVLLAIGAVSARTEGGTVITGAASLREEHFDVVVIADHAVAEDLVGGVDIASFAAWLSARRAEEALLRPAAPASVFWRRAGFSTGGALRFRAGLPNGSAGNGPACSSSRNLNSSKRVKF